MALPTITGKVVRRIELYCGVAGSDKEYVITVTQDAANGFRVFFAHGPRGRLAGGGEKTTTGPVSEAKANEIANALTWEKVHKKHYQVVADITPERTSTSPAAKTRPTPRSEPKVSAGELAADNRALLMTIF